MSNDHIILEHLVEENKKSLEFSGTTEDFFGNFSAMQILKNYELSYEEIEKGNVDGTLDGGIDNIYFFVNDEILDWQSYMLKEDLLPEDNDDYISLANLRERHKNIRFQMIIIQSKYSKSFKEDPITKLKNIFNNLLDFDKKIKDFEGRYIGSILHAFSVFKEIYFGFITSNSSFSIEVYYASKGSEVHSNVRGQAAELEQDIKNKIPSANIVVSFVGAKELMQLYHKQQTTKFFLNMSENVISNGAESYIGIVSISNYYKFITDEQQNLIKHIFDANVRDYQGSNNVNTEIAETLDKKMTEDFWWLNNGVTILCSSVVQASNKNLTIENPSIVNGLQTSTEIYRFFKNKKSEQLESDDKNVLVRIIVPPNDESRDLIIKATNNQTTIPAASLRATDPIHLQIEIYLKSKGLFYDRRKNFYKNDGKKPKEIVSIPFMSQCLISVLMQKPDYARARPSTLLKDDASYNRLFSEKNSVEIYYILAKLGKRVEEVSRSIKGLSSNESSDIKFHILYAVVALATKEFAPKNQHIELLKEDDLEAHFEDAIDIVKELYLEHGATNKVAKSQEFKDQLIEKITQKIAY